MEPRCLCGHTASWIRAGSAMSRLQPARIRKLNWCDRRLLLERIGRRQRRSGYRVGDDAQALKSEIWQLLFGLETVKQGLEHRGEVVAAAGNGGKREHHLHYLLDGEIVSHLLRVLSGRE